VQGLELLSKILSLAYTPSGLQYKRKFRGESLPGKPGGTSFGQYAYSAAQALVQRLRSFPEIPDFLETPEESPEYPDPIDKIVLSGDFSGLAYSLPLGDIKTLSPSQVEFF
jgi:hypothetical protein